MVDDDPDDGLASRLDSALRSGLDHDQVDVAELVQGSRTRAHRIRTRRIAAAVTAAVVILGVPVGYEVLNPGAASSSQSAAMLPSGSRSGPTRVAVPAESPRPVPSAAPSAVPPGTVGSATGLVGILDDFAFTAAELPAGLVLQAGTEYRAGLLVEGQDCDGGQAGDLPDAGRSWLWAEDQGDGDQGDGDQEAGDQGAGAQSRAGGLTVSLTVTGWAGTDAEAAFAAAINQTGACHWSDRQRSRPSPAVSADEIWASSSDPGDRHDARVLIRTGRGIVGIQVQHPDGSAAAAALADQLAETAAERLQQTKPPGS